MMTCFSVQNCLPQYLEGDLSDYYRSETELHIRNCEKCAAKLREMQKMVQLLNQIPPKESPRDFKSDINQVIRKKSGHTILFRKLFMPYTVKIPVYLGVFLIGVMFLISSELDKNQVSLKVQQGATSMDLVQQQEAIKESLEKVIWNEWLSSKGASLIIKVQQLTQSAPQQEVPKPVVEKSKAKEVTSKEHDVPIETSQAKVDESATSSNKDDVNTEPEIENKLANQSFSLLKMVIEVEERQIEKLRKSIIHDLGENVLPEDLYSELSPKASEGELLFTISSTQKEAMDFLDKINHRFAAVMKQKEGSFETANESIIARVKGADLFSISFLAKASDKKLYDDLDNKIKGKERNKVIRFSNNLDIIERL